MTAILDFYYGGQDNKGRTLKNYLKLSAQQMEKDCTFIQWMFPLSAPSKHNENAPILTSEDIIEFQNSPLLLNNVRIAFNKWLWFNGLYININNNRIEIADLARLVDIYTEFNHNWLRVTRVLLCLYNFGLHKECRMYYAFLKNLRDLGMFDKESFAYWEDAVVGITRK